MTEPNNLLDTPYTDKELDDWLNSDQVVIPPIARLRTTMKKLRSENKQLQENNVTNKKLTVLNATVKYIGEIEKASHNVPCVKLEYVTPSNIPTVNQTVTLVLNIKNAKNFHYNQDVIITIEEASND